MLKGTYTALITPFINGKLDEEGFIKNIDEQIDASVEGLIFLGTTGEAPTLTPQEQKRVLQIGIARAKNKVLCIAGTGTNCTQTTLEKTQLAKDLGADMALIINPYYNKPTQEGLYRHFEALSCANLLPLLAYNHPARTGVHLELNTLLKIAELEHVIGLKEAHTGDDHLKERVEALSRHHPAFSILCGCDEDTFKMMQYGGHGVISVISNLVPKEMKLLTDLCFQGRYSEAQDVHQRLSPLMEWACIETNPIPIKAAMNCCQKAAGECRLPLCELSPTYLKELQEFLENWEVLSPCKN